MQSIRINMILLLIILFSFNLVGQPNAEPGKCYARCLIQDTYEYEYYYEYFLRYTGDEPFQEGVEEISFVMIAPKENSMPLTRWVKKKADRNCLSADPEDCLVWCLVNPEFEEEETEYFFEVTDTFHVKDFKLDSVEITSYDVITKGGFTEWRETICDADVDNNLNMKIQKKLIDAGYDIPSGADGQFGASSKAALVKYQKENGLPVGNLNIETMSALGVMDNNDE